MSITKWILPVALPLMFASPALAQEDQHGAGGQSDVNWPMPEACTGATSEASDVSSASNDADGQAQGQVPDYIEGFEAALAKQDRQMPGDNAQDPDVDFVRRTIPHHQALIDISQVYLDHSEDEMITEMAQLFIVSQRGQIASLCDWLEKHHQG